MIWSFWNPQGSLLGDLRELWEVTGRSPARIFRAGRLTRAKLKLLDEVERLTARPVAGKKMKGRRGCLPPGLNLDRCRGLARGGGFGRGKDKEGLLPAWN